MKTSFALCGLLFVLLGVAPSRAAIVETHTFSSLNLDIPDGSLSGLTNVQSFSTAITLITDVNVSINFAGNPLAFNGDLYVYLTHSTGFSILVNRVGRTASNSFGYDGNGLNITLDDEAANGDVHLYRNLPPPGGDSPLTGSWLPDARNIDPNVVLDTTPRSAVLSSFDGLNASGDWTLFAADVSTGAMHRLVSWALTITGEADLSDTWDGGGTDDNFTSPLNWVDDTAPSPGTSSDLFFAGATRLTPNNNFAAGSDFRNLTFNAGAGAFTIGGNAIDLYGKIENLSTATQSVNLTAITLNSATANQFNPTNGNLNIGGTDVFTNGNPLNVFGDNGFTLTFSPSTIISQGGGVAINENSNVVYQSAHTYTGDTVINAGSLRFGAGGSANSSILQLGATTGTAPATLSITDLDGGTTISSQIAVRAGSSGLKTISATNTSGTNTFSGGIVMDAPTTLRSTAGGILAVTTNAVQMKTFALTVAGEGTTTISSQLTSTGVGNSLNKVDVGRLVLTNTNNTFDGPTTITGGILEAAAVNALGATGNGVAGAADITVNNGGTLLLSGSGTINRVNDAASITLAGGAIARGLGANEGSTSADGLGALTLSANSTVDFGSDVGVLTFENFTPAGFTLSIINYFGVPNTVGTSSTDRLIFNADQTSNLTRFSFVDYGVGATQFNLGGGYYEITPVPEPATVFGGLLCVGLVGWRERRRLATWFGRAKTSP